MSLFAHCPEKASSGAIEFADGLHTIAELVDVVPADFSGVMDLTICYFTRLMEAIKHKAPRCQIVLNRKRASLGLRLAIYREAVRLVATGGYSHVDALAEIQLSLLKE